MVRVLIMVLTTVLTAIVSLSGGFLLLSDSKAAKLMQRFSLPFAVLILFYAVFGDILPEVLEAETLKTYEIAGLVALGLVVCAAIRFVSGRFHKHGDDRELKNHGQATAMFIVDSLHTAADGVVLGLAFASSLGTGLLTAAATAAHEIPQEIGDFSIMVRSGLKKRNILKLQLLSAAVLLPVALVAYFIGDALEAYLPVVLSLIAGNLLYIALGEIWLMVKTLRARLPSLGEKANENRNEKEKK